MIYQERIVCYLDILGFKERIDNTVNPDGTENAELIKLLEKTFDEIRYYSSSINDKEIRKDVTQFSDTLVISFPVDTESEVFHTIVTILWIQIYLARNGRVCRGAISRGQLIHTENKLFGPGLVTAYSLEKKAKYPRVVLDESVLHAAINAPARHHDQREELESILGLLAKDEDGYYYIDYFREAETEFDNPPYDFYYYLLALYDLIAAGLKNGDVGVVKKFEWMSRKYNDVVSDVKAGIEIRGLEEEFGDSFMTLTLFP